MLCLRSNAGNEHIPNTGLQGSDHSIQYWHLKVRRDGLWVLYSIDEEGIEKSYDCLIQLVRSTLNCNELADVDRERLKSAVRESPCMEPAGFLDR